MNQLKAGLTHEDIYKRFSDGFTKLAQEIMSDVITEYLPHAESDLDQNVYYRSMEYIAGNFDENTIFGEMGKRFRRRIFEEYTGIIIGQLNQDNLDRIADLERDITELKRQLWERR